MFKRLIGGISDVVQSATTPTTGVRMTPDVSPARRVPDQQELDLSGLSNEEREKILSVMEKADDMQIRSTGGGNSLRTSASRQSTDSAVSYSMQKSVSNISMSSTNVGDRQTFAPSWGPPTSDVGDIDLTGLSEEEKLKVLSVMQKADNEFLPIAQSQFDNEPRRIYGDNAPHVQPLVIGGGAVSLHDVPSSKRLDSSAIEKPLFAIMTNKEETTIKPNEPVTKQQYIETKSNVQIQSHKRVLDDSDEYLTGDVQSSKMDIDLTGLTPEERKQILHVMAKAGQQFHLESTPPRKQPKQITSENDKQHIMKHESSEKNIFDASSAPLDVNLSGLSERQKILSVMHQAENAIPNYMQSEKVIPKPAVDHFDHFPQLSMQRAPEAISPFSPSTQPQLDLTGMSEQEKRQIMAVMQKAEGMEPEKLESKKQMPKKLSITDYPSSRELSPMISPSMLDVDLSGMNEEEKRQIMAVMQKAEAMPPDSVAIKKSMPKRLSITEYPSSRELSPMISPPMPDVDLSGMSEEEKRQIMAVMQKAEGMVLELVAIKKPLLQRLSTTDYPSSRELSPMISPSVTNIDLTGLSDSERNQILSVMQKADQADSSTISKFSLPTSEFGNELKQPKSSLPLTPTTPDLDFTGLSEEEKQKILSIVMKSEETAPQTSHQGQSREASSQSAEEREKILSVATKSEKMPIEVTSNVIVKSTIPLSKPVSSMFQPPAGSEMDLSGLTEEERAQILSVMSRAEEPQQQQSSFFSKLTSSEISSTSFTAFSQIRKTVSSVTTGISQTLEQTLQTKEFDQPFMPVSHDDYIPPAPSAKFIVHENLKVQQEHPEQDFVKEETQAPIVNEIVDEKYDANEYEEESAHSEETEGADEVSFEESENEEPPVIIPLASDQAQSQQNITNDDMDLDLSGLSDDERRHILMVMNRANEMEFTPIKPLSPLTKPETYSPRKTHSGRIEENEELRSTSPLSDRSLEDDEPSIRPSSVRRKSSTKVDSLPVIEEPEGMDEEEWESEYGLRYQYNRHAEDYNQTAVPIVVHPPSPCYSEEEKDFDDKERLTDVELGTDEKFEDEEYVQNDEKSYYDYSPDDNTSAGSPSEWNSESQFVTESFTAQIRTSIDLPDEIDMSEKFSPSRTPEEQVGYIEAEESFSAPLRQSFDIEEENDQYPTADVEFDKTNELVQQFNYEYDKYESENVGGSYVSRESDYYADQISPNNYDDWNSTNCGQINPNLEENYYAERANDEDEDSRQQNFNDDENYAQYEESQFESKPVDYTYKESTEEVSDRNISEADWRRENLQMYQESDMYNYDNAEGYVEDETKLCSTSSNNDYPTYGQQEDNQYFVEDEENSDSYYKINQEKEYKEGANADFEKIPFSDIAAAADTESFFDEDTSEIIGKGVESTVKYYDKPTFNMQNEASFKLERTEYNYAATPLQVDTSAASSIYYDSELTPSESNISNDQKEKIDKSLEIDSGTDSVIGSFMMDETELPEGYIVESESERKISPETKDLVIDNNFTEHINLPSSENETRLRSDSLSTEGPDEDEVYGDEDYSPTSDEPKYEFQPVDGHRPIKEYDNQYTHVPMHFNPVLEEFLDRKDIICQPQNRIKVEKSEPQKPSPFYEQQTVPDQAMVSESPSDKRMISNISNPPVISQSNPMIPTSDHNPMTPTHDQTYAPKKTVEPIVQSKVVETHINKPPAKSSSFFGSSETVNKQPAKSSSFFGSSSMFNVKKFDLGGIPSAIKSQTEQVIKKATSTNINILPTAIPSSAASSRKSSFADTQEDFGVDLAGLSSEEKEHILSVMAKANEATTVSVMAVPSIIPVINKPIVDRSFETRTEDVVYPEDKRDTMVGFAVSYGSESSHETEDTGYASRNSPFEDEMYDGFSHDQPFPVMHIPETIVEDKNWKEEVSSEPIVAPEVTYQRSAATYNPFLSQVEQHLSQPNPIPEIVIPGMPDLDLSQFNEEERQHLLAMFYKANEMEHEIEEREVKQPVPRAGSTPQLPLLDRPIPVIREIQPTPEANVDYVNQFEQRFRDNFVTGSTESINKPGEDFVSHLQQYDSSEVSSDINDDEEQQKRIREIESELAANIADVVSLDDGEGKMELCPLCLNASIQYAADGQNITGQACAYCGTVVCVTCGQVRNFSTNKSLWLCRLCQPQMENENFNAADFESIEYNRDFDEESSKKSKTTTTIESHYHYDQPRTIISTHRVEIPEMEVIDTSPEDHFYTKSSQPSYPISSSSSATSSYDNVLTPRKKHREDGDSDDSDEETSSTSDDDYPDEVIEVPREQSSLTESRSELEHETESQIEAVGGDVLAEIAKTFASSMADVDFDVSPRSKPAPSPSVASHHYSNFPSTNPFVQAPIQPPPIPARSQTVQPIPLPPANVANQHKVPPVTASAESYSPITVVNFDQEPQGAKVRPSPRTSSSTNIQNPPIEEDEPTQKMDSAESDSAATVEDDDIDYTQALKYYNSQPFYTHRSGPVYTIPEDEEEPEEIVPQPDKYEQVTRESFGASPRLTLISPEDDAEALSPISPAASPPSSTTFISTEVSPVCEASLAQTISVTFVTQAVPCSAPSYVGSTFDFISDQTTFHSLPYFAGSRSGGQLVRDVTSLVSSQHYFIQKAQTEQHLASNNILSSSSATVGSASKIEPRPIRAAPPPPPPPTANNVIPSNWESSFTSSTYIVNQRATLASILKENSGIILATVSAQQYHAPYSVSTETTKNIIYATPHIQYSSSSSTLDVSAVTGTKNLSSNIKSRPYAEWSAVGDLSPIQDATQWVEQNELEIASETSSYDNLKKLETRTSIDSTSSSVGRIETSEDERDRFVSRLKRSPAMILHSGEEQGRRPADRRPHEQSSAGGIVRVKNPFLVDPTFAEPQDSNPQYGAKDEPPHRASEMGRRRLPNIPQTAASFQQNPPVDDAYASSSRWRERLQETTDAFSSGSGTVGTSWKSPASSDQRQRLVQTSGTLKMPATLARVLLKQELREALGRRMRQLETSEIEANQRQYSIQRHILTGVYPRSVGIDSAPAQTKCSLPPELVEGCHIELRKAVGSNLLSGATKSPKSPRRTAQFGFVGGDSNVSLGTASVGTQSSLLTKFSSKGVDWEKPIRSTGTAAAAEWERSAKNEEWERNFRTSSDWERGSTSWTSSKKPLTTKLCDAETQTFGSGLVSSEQRYPNYKFSSWSDNIDVGVGRSSFFGGRASSIVAAPKTPSKSVSTNTEREDPFSLRDADLAARKARKLRSRRSASSAYFSDDDDSTSREMRKSKIREEIARRREKLSGLSTSTDLRDFYQPSDYSSHVPHYGSLPRIDYPQMGQMGDLEGNFNSLPRYPTWSNVDTLGGSLQPYHKVHPMYHSDLGYFSDIQDYGRTQPPVTDYRRPMYSQTPYSSRYMSRSLPYLDQLDRYYSTDIPQMSSTTRSTIPPITQQQQQLPESGLLSHYANYLNEQFLNRPSTSGDYVWGNQQNLNHRLPPSAGLYPDARYPVDPLYQSRSLVPTYPQTQQQQSWLHRTPSSSSANPYRSLSSSAINPQYYSLPSQTQTYASRGGYQDPSRSAGYTDPSRTMGYLDPSRSAGYQDPNRSAGYQDPSRIGGYQDPGRIGGYQDPTRSGLGYQDPMMTSTWQQPSTSTWQQPSTSTLNRGVKPMTSWRQAQPPYDSLMNRNDSGYSSGGGYLSDSLSRNTFRRRDYQGPTDINELYSGPLSNVKLQTSGITKGQQRQHLRPPTITVCSNPTPEAITYNDNRPVNTNSRYVPNHGGAVKRILLTRDPKDRSVKGHGLGMKVIGGKILPEGDGELGAYVAAVYKGGLVDTMGEVKEGDQIMEWNGIPLSGKTYEEVQRIIDSSEGEIEIVVKTGANLNQVYELEKQQNKSMDKGYESGSGVNLAISEQGGVNALASLYQILDGKASPCFSTTPRSGSPLQVDTATGQLRARISFDDETGTLFVTIISARDLRARGHIRSGYPNPFVKIYLLPSRRVENKRRTKFIQSTCNPEWNQTVVYKDLSRNHLYGSFLEFTVWDYDRFENNEFLGQIVLSLADPAVVSSRARWYQLQPRLQTQHYNYNNYYTDQTMQWLPSSVNPIRSYNDIYQNAFQSNELTYDDLLLRIQRM